MRAAVIRAEWSPRSGYAPTQAEEARRVARVGSQVWRRPSIRVDTTEDPRPGPEEVLVRIRVCGVCGSDRSMVRSDAEGYMMYPGYTGLPVIPGHEFSGEVVEAGSDVTGLRVGAAVACDNMVWCGRCSRCRADAPNQCEFLEEIGFTVAGGLAEHVTVPSRCCWNIAPLIERWGGQGFEAGALVEPTAVAYQGIAVEASGFPPGSAVAIFGGGPIGLAALALVRAMGAETVVVFQPSETRQRLARELGADVVANPVELDATGTRPRDLVMELTHGKGAQLQIEAAGALPDTLPEMLASLAPRGKIVLLGRSPRPATVFLDPLQVTASRIIGSIGHAGRHAFPGVIHLMASGRLDLLPMVTARVQLEDVAAVLTGDLVSSGGKTLVQLQQTGHSI